jgi:N-glycosylase/DNA lyase
LTGANGVLDSQSPTLLPLPPEEPFDPEATFRCGQIFRWHAHGDIWYGPYGRSALAVRRVSGGLEVRALGAPVTSAEAARLLGLDVSLANVYCRLSHDRWVAEAIAAAPGLRILRQDPWDCVAGYICSQWNNIPKIELSTGRLARELGEVHRWPEGVEVAAFPRPEALAARTAEELRGSALGYRCDYLVQTARRIAAGDVDFEALRRATYDEALAALLALPGIGRKVADCILLFSLDHPQACPVDVWVRRVIHELYPRELERYLPDAPARLEKGLSNVEYRAVTRFAWDRWGDLAGYAQQYLFHARRHGLISFPQST